MTMLDRYLLRTIGGSVLMVMAVFLTLGGLFLFIGQQDDIADRDLRRGTSASA